MKTECRMKIEMLKPQMEAAVEVINIPHSQNEFETIEAEREKSSLAPQIKTSVSKVPTGPSTPPSEQQKKSKKNKNQNQKIRRNIAKQQKQAHRNILAGESKIESMRVLAVATQLHAEAAKLQAQSAEMQAKEAKIQAEVAKVQAEESLILAQAASKIGDVLILLANKNNI